MIFFWLFLPPAWLVKVICIIFTVITGLSFFTGLASKKNHARQPKLSLPFTCRFVPSAWRPKVDPVHAKIEHVAIQIGHLQAVTLSTYGC